MSLKTPLSSQSAEHRRADAGQERHKLFLVCKVKNLSPRLSHDGTSEKGAQCCPAWDKNHWLVLPQWDLSAIILCIL